MEADDAWCLRVGRNVQTSAVEHHFEAGHVSLRWKGQPTRAIRASKTAAAKG